MAKGATWEGLELGRQRAAVCREATIKAFRKNEITVERMESVGIEHSTLYSFHLRGLVVG